MRVKVTGKPGLPDALAELGPWRVRVLIGRNGIISAEKKRESDGCTPTGIYRMMYGFFRPDRVTDPLATPVDRSTPGRHLLWMPMTPNMGWCDAPHNPLYNQFVPVGFPASYERLWRDDQSYDYVIVLDHNSPAQPGFGSAVFVHLWDDHAVHTAGCVAFRKGHLLEMLARGVDEIEIVQG
jgi:L,D-peptidoglycan transpeptidase YkuD (ErfK/YbiS/YcfS/YnhG family)